MLGSSLPRSSMAPAKIMAVQDTNVKPKAASGTPVSNRPSPVKFRRDVSIQRMSGISGLAIDG